MKQPDSDLWQRGTFVGPLAALWWKLCSEEMAIAQKNKASGQRLVTVVSDTTLHVHEHKSNETHHCLWYWDCTHDLQA